MNEHVHFMSQYHYVTMVTDSVADETVECHCPKPCKQIIYEPSLSQAALSFLSVDNILSDSQQLHTIQTSFHQALEVTHI